MSNIDYAAYIADVGLLESQDVHPASHWRQQVHDRNNGLLSQTGDCLPWTKTQDKFRLRQGELTVWAGYDGHMKSMILGQIMAHISFEKRVAIASLEMKPEATLLRMCRQVTGCKPSPAYVDKFLDHGHDKILIYDQLDMVQADRILGFLHHCAAVEGCKHIVLDSLTKLAFPENDRTQEIVFVNRLQFFAKQLGVHVHLICHCRKPQVGDESKRPNKTEIRGSSQITNLADNVVLTWNNKRRARAIDKQMQGLPLSESEIEAIENQDEPDQLLIVDKQREGEWEGSFALWFDRMSTQFLGGDNHPRFSYMDNQHEKLRTV
jgi:twinkle protein